jgi:4-hydroxy-3-polyprenylbenzoate decarboxylase
MDDLRGFLEKLKEFDDLVVIDDEIDSYEEAGAIMRRANEIGAKAQLFTNIKDYEKGFRLAGGILSTYRRMAVAMEMGAEAKFQEILDEYIERRSHPIKPMVVESGPCKENKMIGENVDLLKFPVPHLHSHDGGRYIGTLNVGICKDPDSDWVNWGTYRAMIHDKRSTGLHISPITHGRIILNKYLDRGKKMDYVIVIGPTPVTYLASTAGIPYGVNEMDIVGGLRKEPVQLVKCETSDLYVPAESEIVIEGEIGPGVLKEEGPFGEYPGYSVSGPELKPVFKVKAVTYRNDPIMLSTCLGVPTDDGHILWGLAVTADIWLDLKEAGLPVTGVYIPHESGMLAIVVSTKTPNYGVPSTIASKVWSNRNGKYYPKVFVVDDDIDHTNLQEVFHAFSTKCNPANGVIIHRNTPTSAVTPYLPAETRDAGIGGANVLFDCTWPFTWKDEEKPALRSFKSAYSEPLKEKVISNWSKWGF